MEFSELLAWLGFFILFGVTAFFIIFGKASKKYKHIKMFGISGVILGNKSAVIPTKVLYITFGLFCVCMGLAGVLYYYGY